MSMNHDYDILLYDNVFMDPAMPHDKVYVAEAFYNRNHNTYYHKALKNMFKNLIVLKDCDCSNQDLEGNDYSPALVMGTYNIENTRISDLVNAPCFAFLGAKIKGTPLAQKLGKDFLSGAEYNKLRAEQNGQQKLQQLTNELTFPIYMDKNQVHIYKNAVAEKDDDAYMLLDRTGIVVLGDCDLRNLKNLLTLRNGVSYIGGNLDISGTQVQTIWKSVHPRYLKGDLIFTDTPLAKYLGRDRLNPEEYALEWKKHNQPSLIELYEKRNKKNQRA